MQAPDAPGIGSVVQHAALNFESQYLLNMVHDARRSQPLAYDRKLFGEALLGRRIHNTNLRIDLRSDTNWSNPDLTQLDLQRAQSVKQSITRKIPGNNRCVETKL